LLLLFVSLVVAVVGVVAVVLLSVLLSLDDNLVVVVVGSWGG
jgi:dolichol kinase